MFKVEVVGISENFCQGFRVKKFPFHVLVASPLFFACPADALPPAEALRQMKVADGFTVSLVACEPDIRQPLSISFDERGRMWVVQYLQYPTPAGLKPAKVDPYLRTTYDKIPEPPPRGPKGADRITICEDTDGDGRMDKFHDFVSDLNLCSGMAIGYDGVFVAQPPYLLFYADKNHDDIPDGDPEVLLTGFGMEDAHAFANSLTWGPDGWLYGAQGSTVTAHIRGIEFQQGIWRYHPRTREFELFAEGGGNTWGLDFDPEGEIFAGTNFYERMLHQVQGAYYIKNFGKHGELHNPHAYGYFDHVPYSGYKGLHISIGGIVYQGGAFPAEFNGSYIFANTLDHAVYWAKFQPNGSSFTASFGGTLLKTDDELFRPIDCTTGPDGAVYIADWCDKRATHVDPLDTWDRSNGRIYRIQSNGASSPKKTPFNLAKLSSNKLVDLLHDPNDWFVRAARQILAERRDAKIILRLERQILQGQDSHLQLQSLWALNVTGGFNDPIAAKLLQHPNPVIRKWTIRLLGDTRDVSSDLQSQVALLAHKETSAPVRSQLASSARRLPAAEALPVIRELSLHDEDASDPFIPLLLWWALENKITEDKKRVVEMFSSTEIWESSLVQRHILERLARRFAAVEDFESCASLLSFAPSESGTARLFKGMELGVTGKKFDHVPPVLQPWFQKFSTSDNQTFLRLAVRLGDNAAAQRAFELVADKNVSEDERAELIEILGQAGNAEHLSKLLSIFETSNSEKIRSAALSALQRFSVVSVGERILASYHKLSDSLRNRVIATLASRPAWAELLIAAVEGQRVPAKAVTIEQVRQMSSFQNAGLNQRIAKIWGRIQTDSPEEKRNSINQLKLVLKPSGAAGRDAKGNPVEGKQIFQQACAVCHKLFGEGNTIGPDLTGVDRKNTEFLLSSIVDPSAYIRNEFTNFEVETKDEQSISGLMVESNAGAVTLVDRNNQRHTISQNDIKEIRESQTSLMPEGLLESLQPQQVLDLFSYLQKD